MAPIDRTVLRRADARRRGLLAAVAAAPLWACGTARAMTARTPPVDPARLPVQSGTVDRVLASESAVLIHGVRYAYSGDLPPVPGEPGGKPVAWRAGTRVRFQANMIDGRLRLVSASEGGR